ncbi:MAG TPA: hypothetical protein VLJ13_05840 [Brevundimonas sp.]|nr:hypothetical protein [Brevundimonas sp.]
MRLAVVGAVSALILAACSPEPAAPTAEAAPPEPAPVLAGVDLGQPLRALGTEPFWGVDLTGTELVYAGVDRPEQRAPQPAPVVQGTTATYEATTGTGATISLMLAATECSDGMSDRVYPLSAIVKIGDETLTGCAASTAAIMSRGESGSMADAPQPAG